MKHTAILKLALAAGGWDGPPGEAGYQLYAYARERKFPLPETLARKSAELVDAAYPWASIEDAPEQERVFFTAFRAVAEALEPFHEDDDPVPVADPTADAADDGGASEAVVQTAGDFLGDLQADPADKTKKKSK